MPRDSAASITARPSAPLCDEKPIEPHRGAFAAKVALSRGAAAAMPRQFGPISRAPCERTSASSRSCRSTPSAPISAKPAEMTQIARTPLRSASSAAGSTCSPGTQITTRSTGSGISSIDVYARTPATDSPERFTGYATPAKSASRTFRKSSPPIDPRRARRADDGDGRGLEERAKRRDDRLMVAALDAFQVALGRCDRERELDLAAGNLARDREADRLEDAEHLTVVRQNDRDEPLDPEPAGECRELLEQARADAAPLVLVRHREGDLRGRRIAQAHEVRDGDDLVVDRADERTGLLPVDARQRLDETLVDRREAVEAPVQAPLRETAEKLEQRLVVGRPRRPEPKRGAVTQDDVERLRDERAHDESSSRRRRRTAK